jgi:hypothetical protein
MSSRASVNNASDFSLFLEQFVVFVILEIDVEDSADERY